MLLRNIHETSGYIYDSQLTIPEGAELVDFCVAGCLRSSEGCSDYTLQG